MHLQCKGTLLLLPSWFVKGHNAKLDKFRMQENFLLNNIQQVGVDSLKALKLLRGKRKTSSDCIMMENKMYLQNSLYCSSFSRNYIFWKMAKIS